MTLRIIRTRDERLVGRELVAGLRVAKGQGGEAVLFAPILALVLEAQRALADVPGLALGVECTTPDAWCQLRWNLYGDGRTLVSAPVRGVLMTRLLHRSEHAPLDTGDGTAEVLCQLAARGLPWLSEGAEGLSAGEARAVELARAYGQLLTDRGMVEPCEALLELPARMGEQGVHMPSVFAVGFSSLPRATREFLTSLAAHANLVYIARVDDGPATELVEEGARSLAASVRAAGGQVAEEGPLAGGEPQMAAPAPESLRAPELERLLGSQFCPAGSVVAPTGAVRVLEPSGPLATDEVVRRHVVGLARHGARRVVVVAPDVASAWRGLAPKLRAGGLTVRAQLSTPAVQTRAGAGILRLLETLARLVELDATWPEDPAVLPDMSWWPPRELSDLLLSDVVGVGSARAWRRDSAWRGNRILTPGSVLSTLQNPSATSPAFAAAVRELLQGHVGAAVLRLAAAGAQGWSGGSDAEGEGTHAPAAPSAEEALAAAEDAAALAALADTGRALRDAGVSLGSDGATLADLAALARAALGRSRVTLRPELACEAAPCVVELVSPGAAAALAPRSADALVYLGLDSLSSPIPTPDGALDVLLAHAGVDTTVDGLARTREAFAAALRVPVASLALVRSSRDAKSAETFPAVMLSEAVACYGTKTDDNGDECPVLVPDPASRLDEGLVEENLSASGSFPEGRSVPGPAHAGGLDARLRELVVVPRDGQPVRPDDAPSLSASQIETYLECPYKWFTLRRLGLDDCDAGFTNMEMGTFAHRVLEVTHRTLMLDAARAAGLVADDVGEAPQEGLFWFDPRARVPGSRVDEATLAHATELLRTEFAEHLAHQRAGATTRAKQALVPHGQTEARQLVTLERDLVSTLEYEAELFRGYEPRLFEGRFGGSAGLSARYAGADLVGTIDRIDVDAEGRAVVIDYKHKSSLFDEYSLLPKDFSDDDWKEGFRLPRRVQTLVYATVAQRLLASSGIEVVGAVYLGTRGNHQLAGVVEAARVGEVWGTRPLSEKAAPRVSVPVPGARSFAELLERTEEHIGEAIGRMRAGCIDANPIAPDACKWCPVLNCERRRS